MTDIIDSIPESLPASHVPASESDARRDHEASDVVDHDPNVQLIAQHDTLLEAPHDDIVKDADAETLEDVLEAPKKPDAVPSSRSTPASKEKTAVLPKSGSGKVNASTPTDKKALNAATLGAANSKAPSPGKPTATPSSPLSKTATPSTAKKQTTTSSKAMASSRAPSGPAPPSRRASMLPPRAPSATGVPPAKSRTSTMLAALASSASSKSPLAEVNATSRPSVVSPVGSVTSLKSNATGGASAAPPRPRAAVSEAVKRTPSSSRQSLPPAAVQPPQSRTMRPMGSISSIREVRDDTKAFEDLQEKLREANGSLSAKSDAVAALEAKVLQLEASLDEALVAARTKASSIEQLQISKQSSDTEITALKARLQQVQVEHSRDLVTLESVSKEIENARESMTGQAENIKALETHVETLQVDIVAAHENFESLRSSSDQSSAEAAAAAQMEREAFLRAKADVETVTAELNTLRATHGNALQEAAAISDESQQRAAEVITLTTQVGELKAEREESAAKISELEVEILELKENQENMEDEHKRSLDRLQKLETELAVAVAATQEALRDAEVRDAESTGKAASVALLHADEVQRIQSDLAEAFSRVEVLETELAAAHVAYDEAMVTARASAEAREQEMEEAEQSYLSKHIELSEEIKRLTSEVEGMEAKYGAKVDAVKAEHEERLQEAFERAKNEAGEVHSQDLQVLRAESQATIEQLRVTHQSTMDDLRAEHETTLESQVGALEKTLNGLSLELRATQDDLSKAKAALDTSRAQGESLRGQLEDARAGFTAASASADQAAEIERLTKGIANVRDENAMLNDVLSVTKESLSEMSANHTKELEEAASKRVEEVMRLRSIHDGELSTLAAQKSELTLSLSDLEGEIAMLKSQLAAAELAATPRSNGAVHASATTVTRDELQKVHEAHNLKMHDLQAEHGRAVRALETEVETLQTRLDEVQADVARKSMEIQYLEQEQEESQDSITRLKADLEAVKST